MLHFAHPSGGQVSMANMIDVDGPALQARVTKILTDPKAEWPVIAAEPMTTEKLYSSYIAPLAAIPVIAGFIGTSIIGVSLPFVGQFRVGIVRGIVHAFVTYVLSLVMVYVAALIVDKLAPTFQSTSNQVQALKLVAYSYTAIWVAGVLNVLPVLMPLGILAILYSIYLFYIGLPVMMKTPEPKAVPYMVVSGSVIIGLAIIVGIFAAAITGVAGIAY